MATTEDTVLAVCVSGTPSQFGISTLRSEPRPRDASETSQVQTNPRQSAVYFHSKCFQIISWDRISFLNVFAFPFQHQRRSRAVAPAAPADHEEVSPPSVQPPNRRRGRQGSFWSSKLLEKLKEKLKNKQKKKFSPCPDLRTGVSDLPAFLLLLLLLL